MVLKRLQMVVELRIGTPLKNHYESFKNTKNTEGFENICARKEVKEGFGEYL